MRSATSSRSCDSASPPAASASTTCTCAPRRRRPRPPRPKEPHEGIGRGQPAQDVVLANARAAHVLEQLARAPEQIAVRDRAILLLHALELAEIEQQAIQHPLALENRHHV